MPETVDYFERAGFKVRELSDMKCLDPVIKEAIDLYFEELRPGAIADLVRSLAVCSEGGIYLDLDEQFEHWDIRAHKIFDFIGFTCP